MNIPETGYRRRDRLPVHQSHIGRKEGLWQWPGGYVHIALSSAEEKGHPIPLPGKQPDVKNETD